jgi:hypothetical protein
VTAGGKENDDATMVYVYIGKRNNDHAQRNFNRHKFSRNCAVLAIACLIVWNN